MKVGAHPMVVAVALGLLGPSALAEEEEQEATCLDASTRITACSSCDCGLSEGVEADPFDVAHLQDAWASLAR